MTGASSFSGIIDYTIGGTGPTGGPTGSIGGTGATAFYKDLVYLAECSTCRGEDTRAEFQRIMAGLKLDGTEPDGATGWYFGASGATGDPGSSYAGPDYTIGGTGAQPGPNNWGQHYGSASVSVITNNERDPSIPPLYVEDKYLSCVRCACPIVHQESRSWSCRLKFTALYPSNTRFNRATVYLVPNFQEAQERMLPNLTSLIPKMHRLDAIMDFLDKPMGTSGATGVPGASAPIGASGATSTQGYGATGYLIMNGAGEIIGATGSSSFMSATADLVSHYRIPMEYREIKKLEDEADKLREEILEFLNVPEDEGIDGEPYKNVSKYCKYDRITNKKRLFQIFGDCEGPDDVVSIVNCPSKAANGDEYWDCGSSMEYDNPWPRSWPSLSNCGEIAYIRDCCCEDCIEVQQFPNRDEEADICDRYLEYMFTIQSGATGSPTFEKPTIKEQSHIITITKDDITCIDGSCSIYYLIIQDEEIEDWHRDCGFAASLEISSAYSDELDELLGYDIHTTKIDINGANYFTRNAEGWLNTHKGISAGLCPLPSFDLSSLCGSTEIPDRATGSNRTQYQYDFTLNNAEYP